MKKLIAILAIIFFLPIFLQAQEIYKTYDEDGVPKFTDRGADGDKVEMENYDSYDSSESEDAAIYLARKAVLLAEDKDFDGAILFATKSININPNWEVPYVISGFSYASIALEKILAKKGKAHPYRTLARIDFEKACKMGSSKACSALIEFKDLLYF